MEVQSSLGIQTLLEVEKESQKIVQKARECRAQGLKNARLEAQTMIEEYRLKKQEAFEKYERELNRSSIKEIELLNKTVDEKLEEIKQQAYNGKEEVVRKIIELLTTCNLEIHPNTILQMRRNLTVEKKHKKH
ncbi:hypothetical protein PCANB_001905 [Pneumocystis canis]|nr:hypothetical protein PCK1_001698 [Pneumocystis canis]KAG5440335.1 hypothetical protein PCANB_001905 [Pneumocystis canis]